MMERMVATIFWPGHKTLYVTLRAFSSPLLTVMGMDIDEVATQEKRILDT